MKAAGGDIGQWDRYWAYGSLHSFSQVADGNYRGAIATFWRERFAELTPGACVVDIASGNGAVALLAREAAAAAGIEVEVHGVDLADIDPARRVADASLRERLGQIRFHARTPAESLPFDDASVDLACSQFGLEYSELGAAIGELARVCRAGARASLVLHHRQSVLLQATAAEIAQLDFVLERARLYVHARNLLRALAEQGAGRAGRDRPKVVRKQRALNEALQRIQREAQRTDNPRMLLGPTNYIREIFAAVDRAPVARLLELLEETRQRILANRQRLLDMQRAARDERELSDLAVRLGQAGFAVDHSGALHEEDGTLLGWTLVATRQ